MKKISFFRKTWYSIVKPSKYKEMKEEGFDKALKYFYAIAAILTVIIGTTASFIQINKTNNVIDYLDEKLPKMSFKENRLSLENEDEIILNTEEINDCFGCSIVINTQLEKKEAADKYRELTSQKNKVLIFLKDKYILISNKYQPDNDNIGILEYKYSDVSSKYIKDTSYEYGKEHVLDYLKQRNSFTYYISYFLIIYFIRTTFLYTIYLVLISGGIFIVTKFSKTKWTFIESFINTLYATTLSMIIYALYSIFELFTKFTVSFMDIINIALIFVYLSIVLFIQNKELKK